MVIGEKWSERMNEQNKNNQDGEEFHEDVELTAAEMQALEKLKNDITPGDLLEERVVNALYKRGLLTKPSRNVIKFTAWRYVATAAACLVLFISGYMIGQRTVLRDTPGIDSAKETNTDFSVAASVQQTGSAYLMALQQLANVHGDLDSDAVIQGKEVALTSLCTAAEKVSHLVPKAVLSDQLLASLDNSATSRENVDGIIIEHNQIIKF
jgi:hypothetical protein